MIGFGFLKYINKKNLDNSVNLLQSFVAFILMFFISIIESIIQPIALIAVSYVEFHRISLGVSIFESNPHYQFWYAFVYIIGFLATTVMVSKYEYKDYEENGFISTKKEHGLLVSFIEWIWIELIGFPVWNNVTKRFQRIITHTKEIDFWNRLKNWLILSGAVFSAIGSLIHILYPEQATTQPFYQQIFVLATQSNLETILTFLLVFIFTFVILTMSTNITKSIVFDVMANRKNLKQDIYKEETSNRIYLSEATDKTLLQIISKYPEKVNENDYVILEEENYQLFDGITNKYVVSRNKTSFKGINTLYTNLEQMLSGR